MSDFSIPGVSSKYKTSEMIDKLVEAEKIPLERMEKSLDNYDEQKKVLQGINRKIKDLREQAQILYSYENPFSERIAASSMESVVTATAKRGAAEEIRTVTVKQTAKADRFISDNLPRDYTVKGGTYTFSVGEESMSFKFGGGSIENFSRAINKRSKGLINTTAVKNTSSTMVFMIESKKTGSENKLTFSDAALDFALEAGLIRKNITQTASIELNEQYFQSNNITLSPEKTSFSDSGLVVNPQSNTSVPIKPSIPVSEGLVLEYKVRTIQHSEEEAAKYSRPDMDFPEIGGSSIEGIRLYDEPLPDNIPEPEPEQRRRIDDFNVLSITGGGKETSLPPVTDEKGFITVQVPLSGELDSLSAINIKNRNTHRSIEIADVHVYDPNARGDYAAKNPVAEASDAIVEVDGIEIIRQENTIEDVIPDVTLNLQRESTQEVELSIEPDKETIKNSIIEFVGYYNQLLTELQIVTRNNEEIVDNIDYFSDEEREAAMERLGMFQGESLFNRMRSGMQNIIISPYQTDAGLDLTMLAQIGVSTNASRGVNSGGIDSINLRGYLQINEDQLDQAIEQNIEGMQSLFGSDSDNDLIVDTGVAYRMHEYVKSYSQTGGLISNKVSTIDRQVANLENDIEDYEEHLAAYEQKLRREYGRMEGMLEEMQKSSEALDGLQNNSNNNQ